MTYVAAAFPSACGKTNFAMMIPPQRFDGLEGLDRRRRHRLDARRRRRPSLGDQPRGRLLRRRARAPTPRRNPNAMATMSRDTIFTNVAHRPPTATCGGRATTAPSRPSSSTGRARPGRRGSKEKAAHPNSRFTAPAQQQPGALAEVADDPQGVPISAIIFGGRRATTRPARAARPSTGPTASISAPPWARETTAAATGKVGVVRRDPMAMLPFCGYNMGDYFGHWLDDAEAPQATRRRSST